MLLVDARSNEAFCASSIRYAINIARPLDAFPDLDDVTMETLEALARRDAIGAGPGPSAGEDAANS